jgi:hypothetical protein
MLSSSISSSVIHSFHWKDLSFPSLNLFLVGFVFLSFFRLLWMGTFLWFLSQSVHCWYIEKQLLIFVYWFHILLLCQKCLRFLKIFLVEFLGSFRYKIISSANRDNLTSFFPVCVPFIYSFCLAALARNPKPLLKKSGESGHPCLVPDFRGNGFHLVWCWL